MEMVKKSGHIEKSASNDEDIALINQYTLKELKADEVFTFKLAMCDNQIDRDFEMFTENTLIGLSELYKGKTVIGDHEHLTANQFARIYKTEIISEGNKKTLVGYCYAVKSESNKDFIADIEGGIKKEVSVGCRVEKAICSICGTDNRRSYCEHWGGKVYDNKQCYFMLDGALDAYEVSFVAVPAQKNAGVIKAYGEKPIEKPIEKSVEDNTEIESDIECDLHLIDAFLFTQNN